MTRRPPEIHRPSTLFPCTHLFRSLAAVNHQLGVKSPPVSGPRFAASEISSEVRIFIQNTRRSQPEQHRHHHQIARAERAIEPVGVTQAKDRKSTRLNSSH